MTDVDDVAGEPGEWSTPLHLLKPDEVCYRLRIDSMIIFFENLN
jgi:hypothetical protein